MADMVYTPPASSHADDDDGIDVIALLSPIAIRWKTVLAAVVIAGVAGYGVSYLVAPKFTATTVFLPPQQQQSSAAGALASLSALSGFSIGNGGTRNSPDQYISLMQSATVGDRIIKKFDLLKTWDVRFAVDARKRLEKIVSITSGKKDGLIRVDVTDVDPQRAAAIANQYVNELRALTNVLAVTEAQQRRVFFEHLLEQTRDKLADAQKALEASGISAGAVNTEPRTAADAYAKLQAQLTAAQVQLQVLSNSLADGAPQVQQQREMVNALTSQLAKLESQSDATKAASSGYIDRYRQFKYQETLFDLFARDYESARVDEGREGALIQVVDPATPPERKSAPTRAVYALVGALLGLLAISTRLVLRASRS